MYLHYAWFENINVHYLKARDTHKGTNDSDQNTALMFVSFDQFRLLNEHLQQLYY